MSHQIQVNCPGCGLAVPAGDGPTHKYLGATPGCWQLYTEVLAREYENPLYFTVHHFTVDTYAVQHPGTASPQTIQSLIVHLVSLYLLVEKNADMMQVIESKKALTNYKDQMKWLEPPAPNGSLTIADVHEAVTPQEHREIVPQWAEDVWRAWQPHHDRVRQWARRVS